ncbi:MAG: AraC family transcriptional regulator [Bacteroidetes bacterium]|nr:MAG: AraC family transcriptional regulator [Bacteroidota bacterium]
MNPNSHKPSAKDALNLEIEMIDQWTANNDSKKSSPGADNNLFRIIWITKGECTVNTKRRVIDNTDFILCLGKNITQPFIVKTDTKGFSISFSADFFTAGEFEMDIECQSNILHLFSSLTEFELDRDSANELKDVFSRMHKEHENLFPFKSEIIKRYLKIFLIYLSRCVHTDTRVVQQTRNMKLAEQFMRSVEQNYKMKRMVADYADLLFVSPNYLNEVIKKMTGISAGHHIRNRVVMEAKRIAATTDYTMKEIAYYLGFDDTAHFSKFFKTTSGNNFTEFKKQTPVLSMIA